MITEIMLALLYWILGVVFALGSFCAIGCVLSLFISVVASFKSPMRLLTIPLWIFFAFLSLGICGLLQWAYVALGGDPMRYAFFVGIAIPGILCATLVPRIIALATGPCRTGMSVSPIDAPKA